MWAHSTMSVTIPVLSFLKTSSSPSAAQRPVLEYSFEVPSPSKPAAASTAQDSQQAATPAAAAVAVEPVSSIASQPSIAAASQQAQKPTVSSSMATPGGSHEALPQELEECYAVISFQRAQIAQLRGRVAQLDEQLAQVRARREARYAARWQHTEAAPVAKTAVYLCGMLWRVSHDAPSSSALDHLPLLLLLLAHPSSPSSLPPAVP